MMNKIKGPFKHYVISLGGGDDWWHQDTGWEWGAKADTYNICLVVGCFFASNSKDLCCNPLRTVISFFTLESTLGGDPKIVLLTSSANLH